MSVLSVTVVGLTSHPSWTQSMPGVTLCSVAAVCCKTMIRAVSLAQLPASTPSPPVDSILAVMFVRELRVTIIRTVLCCVVYASCAQ